METQPSPSVYKFVCHLLVRLRVGPDREHEFISLLGEDLVLRGHGHHVVAVSSDDDLDVAVDVVVAASVDLLVERGVVAQLIARGSSAVVVPPPVVRHFVLLLLLSAKKQLLGIVTRWQRLRESYLPCECHATHKIFLCDG